MLKAEVYGCRRRHLTPNPPLTAGAWVPTVWPCVCISFLPSSVGAVPPLFLPPAHPQYGCQLSHCWWDIHAVLISFSLPCILVVFSHTTTTILDGVDVLSHPKLIKWVLGQLRVYTFNLPTTGWYSLLPNLPLHQSLFTHSSSPLSTSHTHSTPPMPTHQQQWRD